MSKIYIKIAFLFLLLITFCAQWGCNTINPQEKVPTYIHIDSFIFDGASPHDIRYAWVYYNNNPVGAFDLPATVPILVDGTGGSVQIAPGIPINGRGERPVAYPFYKIFSMPVADQPGKIINAAPTVKYFDSVKFTVISEFESGVTKFAKWQGTTSIVSVSADSLKFEGTGTGAVFLNTADDSSIDSTRVSFNVPNGAAFIEFDYKSSVNLAFGMKAMLGGVLTTDVEYLAGVLPNDSWHHFYLNITSFVNKWPGGDYYLFIKTNVPDGKQSGRLLIDNIRLVTF